MVAGQLEPRGIRDARVLEVMTKVPRHVFVDKKLWPMAYRDRPLSIGEGQTISQPFIVAIMTQCLDIGPDDRILEIGTGCGYQTAILSELAAQVFSIERIPSLASMARNNLQPFDHAGIHLSTGDGSLGWPQQAPFDAILVAAASPRIPQPLVEQLNDGGRLVIPIGDAFLQELILVRKEGGEIRQENLSSCRFVKLMGEYGFEEEG